MLRPCFVCGRPQTGNEGTNCFFLVIENTALRSLYERRQQQEDVMQTAVQKITPFLWFNNQAEEAVKFYTSVFKNSRINNITRYDEGSQESSPQQA